MERGDDGTLILSPADVVGHVACAHLTHLARREVLGELRLPEQDDAEPEVRRRRGHEHEERQLARLRAEGRSVVEIEPPGLHTASLEAADVATVAAMRAGAGVIHRGSFVGGRWRARPDLLLRVEHRTDLGSWGYEAVRTTLARRVDPAAVVELCAVTEHLTRIQGVAPEAVVVITADGAEHRVRLADATAYQRAAARRLEAAVDDDGPAPYPHEVPHCARCPWLPRCAARRRADGHLSRVAGVRPDMIFKWAGVGVTTVADLAASRIGEPVPSMGQATADRLRHQARLQLAQESDGQVRYELLPVDGAVGGAASPVAARGLVSLPRPSVGDLFFDIEGDPWVGPHGIQYLFGLVGHSDDGPAFSAFWAHTPEDEQRAVELVVDLLLERLGADPAMHVYHYAPYEVSVLRTLSSRYGTREAEVERLVQPGVFVDLYRIAIESVRVSQDGYGLKKLEPLYLGRREGAITDGAASIVVYERWLATGDQRLLDDIVAYNEIDCRSTLGLRDWLEGRRCELEAVLGAPLARPTPRTASEAEVVGDRSAAPAHLSGPDAEADPTPGLGLDTARRLHPELLRAVAAIADDAPVRPDLSWANQAIGAGALVSGSGLRLLLVPHAGNRDRSVEEVAAIAELVGVLVGRSYTAAAGVHRRLTLDDVLVVTPFDAQVAALVEALPEGARVGTVDRFAGQEAVAVVYSAAASSVTEVPWGSGHLFGPDRLAAAISRAQTMAVVVASPSLLGSRCRTTDQLRVVNAFCRLAELATLVEASSADDVS